jgi:DNA-binding transcriptional MerR regulator
MAADMTNDEPQGNGGAGSEEQTSIVSLLDATASGDERTWTIGELARECNVTLRALRFYEGKGLLDPARTGGARTYDAEDHRRLRLIVRGKQIGLSLIEIRDLLDVGGRGRGGSSGRWSKIRRLLERQAALLDEQRLDVERALRSVHREIAEITERSGS